MQRTIRTSRTGSHNRTTPKAKVLLAGFLVLLLAGLIFLHRNPLPFSAKQENQPAKKPVAIDLALLYQEIEKLCAEYFVPTNWFKNLDKIENLTNGEPLLISASVPHRFPSHRFAILLQNLMERFRFDLLESHESLAPAMIRLAFGAPDGKRIDFVFKETEKKEWHDVKMAIVIDDFGYKDDTTVKDCLNLPFPVAFAVIPGTPYAEKVATLAHQSGFEVLIHLPMEPLHSRVEDNGYTIFTRMSEKQMEEVITRAKKAVPFAVGMNNHMGSRATSNRSAMKRFMAVLKRHDLFFLDSETSRKSVAYEYARRNGIPTLKMTTYLDNPEDSKSVAQKLGSVIRGLRPGQSAIVIGHARKQTIAILKQELPRWAFLGVSFVPVKQLLENPQK